MATTRLTTLTHRVCRQRRRDASLVVHLEHPRQPDRGSLRTGAPYGSCRKVRSAGSTPSGTANRCAIVCRLHDQASATPPSTMRAASGLSGNRTEAATGRSGPRVARCRPPPDPCQATWSAWVRRSMIAGTGGQADGNAQSRGSGHRRGGLGWCERWVPELLAIAGSIFRVPVFADVDEHDSARTVDELSFGKQRGSMPSGRGGR